MINLLAGAVIVALLWYALKSFARTDPRRIARMARGIGGWGAIVVAGLLGAKGQIATAIPLGIFGLSLIGWNVGGGMPSWGRARKSAARASSVKTAFLDMTLDHDSGRLTGTVIGGPYAGQVLDGLDLGALGRLAGEVDAESRQLLETYLDRRSPGWRENAQRDTGGRGAGPARGSAMTEEEAYQVLGLQPGAGASEIAQAHRSLMKRLHPDQGGSNYLAARVNEAKDILMRGHR